MKLYLFYVLLGCLSLTSLVLVRGQSKSGFISIDCGIPEDYTDTTSKIDYSSDAEFVNTGVNSNISTEYSTGNIDQRLVSLRSFPQGIRNCYALRPEQGKNNNYFIRAWFLYGNYDGKNRPPMFDLYIGTNLWDRVVLFNESTELLKEITYEASTNYIQICLVKTGVGTPFISALELRHLNGSIYKSQTGCMVLYKRYDLGSYGADGELRGYDDDELGRLWSPYNVSYLERIYTYFPFDSSNSDYKLPLEIMSNAAKPVNATEPFNYYLDQGGSASNFYQGGSATNFYVYLHFCELEELKDNEVREFDILMNNVPWEQSVVPSYLKTATVTKEKPVSGGVSGELWMDLVKTNKSTLPPILNAMEIYIEKELSESSTYPGDADAMVNISLIYGVKENWQGDPCFPRNLSWEGVNCSYKSDNSTQITSLNLSSSGLTGEIAPVLSSLKSLQYLDLSDNNLTGPVPQDLAQLPYLKILNLTNNNLTGSVPALSVNSSLLLITDGNPNLCALCQQKNEKKKKNQIVVPIIASVASSIVVLTAIAVLWSLKMRRHKGRTLKSKNRRFTYSEVVSITNNFQTKIGKGGFGTVYLGHLEDGTEVAVKMLSRASTQGSEQFWTEAELLTTIHHKNLASLIGYSDQASNTALIYEYMANGDLEEYLLGKNRTVLTWEQRLQIAIDAAQALEYLHNGCRPPIIHRDIKTANILLNEKLQAKVADFGLSRIFPFEDGTHVSTAVVGTFGYLDPEYYITGRLTDKSDVYSFGIVILQLITGLPAIIKSKENTHIIQWVMPRIERGEINDIVDPRLEGDYDNNSAWKVLETAIACVPSSPIQRPTMSHVVGELKECLEIYLACGKALEMSQTTEISRMRSSTAIDNVERLDLESSMMCPQAR